MSQNSLQQLSVLLIIFIAAFTPLFPALYSGAYPADPYSELPVKLWAYRTFAESGQWLGGPMPSISFPNGGSLNNPDIVGSIWMHLGRFLPKSTAYGLMIGGIQFLNIFSIFILAESWTKKTIPALGAALTFGFCAGIQGYVIGGAITDMLHVWPYPMAIWAGLRAFQKPSAYWAIAAGTFFGMGFMTCPYNAVLFSPVAIPLGWHIHQQKNLLTAQSLRLSAALGLSAACIIGLYALQLKGVMSAESSQMSSELVQSTRHQWPFMGLIPDHPDRYVATISDYLTFGKDNLIIRDSGARFYRSYTLGLVGLGLGIFGVWKSRAWLWAVIFTLGLLLSIGPFVSLSTDLFISKPSNPIYLAFYYGWPGTQMILEPFRYQLVATLGLCMMVASGFTALKSQTSQIALALFIPIELCGFSTAPFPQPSSTFETADIYHDWPEHLSGGIIELPYFHNKSRLFVRQHFLNQLSHEQPIVNEVAGFLPALFFENAFLSRLMTYDAPHPVPTGRRETAHVGAHKLHKAGFRSLIFTPENLSNAKDQRQMKAQIEQVLGSPVFEADGRFIYEFQAIDTD